MSGRDGGQDTAYIYHLKPLMEKGYQVMKTQLLSFIERLEKEVAISLLLA